MAEGLSRVSARIARLSMRLQEFLYEVQYVPGTKNIIQNFLSKMSLPLREIDLNPWNDVCALGIFMLNEVKSLQKDE